LPKPLYSLILIGLVPPYSVCTADKLSGLLVGIGIKAHQMQ